MVRSDKVRKVYLEKDNGYSELQRRVLSDYSISPVSKGFLSEDDLVEKCGAEIDYEALSKDLRKYNRKPI